MEEAVFSGVLVVDFSEGLFGVEEGVAGEEVDGFGMVDLQFLLDHHDQFEDCERFEDEDPEWRSLYLLLSKSLSLLFFSLASRTGILSGCSLRMV